MEHGLAKLFGFPSSTVLPAAFSLLWCAGVIEALGGSLLTRGPLTRPVAFMMSGAMAIGYFFTHFPRDAFPLVNGGDAAILYCFVFFYIFAAGSGPRSVDRLLAPGARRDAVSIAGRG